MRIFYCFLIMMGLFVGLVGGDVSLASTKVLEAGYASTSGMGSGEVRDLPDGNR